MKPPLPVPLLPGLLLLATALPAAAQVATSPRYRLAQATVNGGGAPMASASFAQDASAGQESTIGVSSSVHFVVQSGFWSHLGTGLVPVILFLSGSPDETVSYDLDWTGNNAPYALYRSAACSDVFAGGPLLSVSPSNWTEGAPPSGDLVCYNVLATAPGPVAGGAPAFSPSESGSHAPAAPAAPDGTSRSFRLSNPKPSPNPSR